MIWLAIWVAMGQVLLRVTAIAFTEVRVQLHIYITTYHCL
jgi:hypothetical protein